MGDPVIFDSFLTDASMPRGSSGITMGSIAILNQFEKMELGGVEQSFPVRTDRRTDHICMSQVHDELFMAITTPVEARLNSSHTVLT